MHSLEISLTTNQSYHRLAAAACEQASSDENVPTLGPASPLPDSNGDMLPLASSAMLTGFNGGTLGRNIILPPVRIAKRRHSDPLLK